MMIKMLSCNYFKRQKQQLLKTSDCHSEAFKIICLVKYSGLAQPVEQEAVNFKVAGSNPALRANKVFLTPPTELSDASGSFDESLRIIYPRYQSTLDILCSSSSIGRASAFQAECCEFKSRLLLQRRRRQSVRLRLSRVNVRKPNSQKMRIW